MTTLVLTCVLAIGVGGCQGSGKPKNGEATPSGGGLTAPQQGAKYLRDQIVLESISLPSAAGQPVTVSLKNVSGQDLENFTVRLLLFTPSTDKMSEFDTEKVTDEVNKLYMNDSHTLSVVPAGAGKLLKVDLAVSSGEAALDPTTSREGGVPGSRLLGGRLEVVGIDDRLTFENPAISFTVENVSGQVVEGIAFQVVLRKRSGATVQTPWMELSGSLQPGARVQLPADFSGNDIGAAESVLKIRWEDI
jgi:hypothetical protein